jgi:hypothetical protein
MNKITKSRIKHFELKRQIGMVNVERTESIQTMIDGMNNDCIHFLNDIPTLEDVYIHLRNMVPSNELRQGITRKVFKRAGIGDDYGFAINLFYVGTKIMMPNPEDVAKELESKLAIKNTPVGLEKAIEKMMVGYGHSIIVIKPK